MRELRARGVEFVEDATDVGYGVRTSFHAPGDFTIELYEPRYEKLKSPLEDEIERGLRLSARGLDDRAGDRETSVGVREDDDALAGHGIGQGEGAEADTLSPMPEPRRLCGEIEPPTESPPDPVSRCDRSAERAVT